MGMVRIRERVTVVPSDEESFLEEILETDSVVSFAADSPADAEVGCHGHVMIARSVWKTRLPNDKTQSLFLPGMSWA